MLDLNHVMLTLGVMLGCMIVGLTMQVINFVRLRELEHRILVNQAKILVSIPQPVSMEDLMLQSIQEASVSQEDFDNMIDASNAEIMQVLNERAADVNADEPREPNFGIGLPSGKA